MYLLTYHGTVVCGRDDGPGLMHAASDAIPLGWSPVRCDLQGGEAILRSSMIASHGTSFSVEASLRGTHVVYLRRAGRYLRALPTGDLDVLVSDASGWEQMLLLDSESYDLVRGLSASAWIDGRGLLVRAGRIILASDFEIVGLERPIKLTEPKLPLASICETTHNVHVFRDGWKVERLTRFRPLIYYCAFGSNQHLELFRLAVLSFELVHPGMAEYLLFTDASESSICELVGSLLFKRLRVVPCSSPDSLDCYLQRYKIHLVPSVEAYRPILYLDTDVMASGDCTPLLLALLESKLVEAGEEVFSPMASRESVGSHLSAEDGIAPPWEFGFNSGSLGFSSAKQHAATFEAVIDVTLRYADSAGRHRLGGWYDQGPANYIAAKLGGFGVQLMTPYLTQVTPAGDVSGATPSLIHFWGTGDRKLDVMRAHLAQLEMMPTGHR